MSSVARQRQPVAALLALLRPGTAATRLAAGAGGVVVLGGLLALLAGVLIMGSRADQEPEQALRPDGPTGDEMLDVIIDSLLNDDAAKLSARFTDVMAREGAVVGGPVGLYEPREVPASEWTARLAAASRTLHAVVEDPSEPFPWLDQPNPGAPRARHVRWRP